MGNAGDLGTSRLITAGCLLPLVILIATACGGGGGSSTLDAAAPPAFDAQVALAEVAGAEPAAGIDAAVWDELTAELERSITARGAAAAPSAGTLVADLAVTVGLDNAGDFTWTYHNAGDYDLNGMVNVSDLTPVGIYYGVSSSDENWASAQYADGNGNGLIDVADITPIGQHYGTYITGYALEHSAEGGEGAAWEAVESVPVDELVVPAEGGWPRFSYHAAEAPVGGYATVVPVQGEGAAAYTRSTEAAVPMNIWGTVGRDFAQSCVSPFSGPAEPSIAWELELPELDYCSAMVIGPNGDIYACDLRTLVAVNQEGEVLWTYTVEESNLVAYPAVEPDGTIHLVTNAQIIELDSAGQVLSTAETPRTRELEYSDFDTRYGPGHAYYGMTDMQTFSAFNLQGEIIWSQQMTDEYIEDTIAFSRDHLFILDDVWDGQYIRCIDYQGSDKWTYPLTENDYTGVTTILAGDDGSLYLAGWGLVSDYVSNQLLVKMDESGNVVWEQEREHSNGYPTLTLTTDNQVIWQPVEARVCTYSQGGEPVTDFALASPPMQYEFDSPSRPLPVTDVDGNTYVVYKGLSLGPGQSYSTWIISGDTQGQRRWILRFPAFYIFPPTPCIGADGRLYVLDYVDSTRLYAIGGGSVESVESPQSVAASDGEAPGRIDVSWAPADGAVEYLVYRDGNEWPLTSVSETNWTDTNVVDQVTYSYSIASIGERTVSAPGAPDTGYAGEANGSPGPSEWSTCRGGGGNSRAISTAGPQTGAVASYLTLELDDGPYWTVFGSDGKAYCTCGETLYALNPDGTIHWQMLLKSRGLSDPVIGDNGVIYVAAKGLWDDGLQAYSSLYSVLAISGSREILWSYRTLIDDRSDNLMAPLAGGGLVIAESGKTSCLDANGAVLWSTGGLDYMAVAQDGSVYGLIADPEVQRSWQLVKIDPDGNELWASETFASVYRFIPIIGSDGNVFVFRFEQDTEADPAEYRSYIRCYSPAGAQLWEEMLSGLIRAPACSGDGIISMLVSDGTSTDFTLYQFDTVSRSVTWSNFLDVEDRYLLSPVVDGEGTTYLTLKSSGTTLAYDSTGAQKWELVPGEGVVGNWMYLSLAPDGKLYISGSNGHLLAIE